MLETILKEIWRPYVSKMQERDWRWKTFTKCEKLINIQNKYKINDPNKVFNEGLSKEW